MSVRAVPLVNFALVTILKGLEENLEELEIRLSSLRHCWDLPEYSKDTEWSDKIWYRTNSSERPPDYNFQRV